MACCGRPEGPTTITVTFPDGTTRTYASRPDAVAAVARAGGGTIKGA